MCGEEKSLPLSAAGGRRNRQTSMTFAKKYDIIPAVGEKRMLPASDEQW